MRIGVAMDPFTSKFVLTDKGYTTANSELSFAPVATPMAAPLPLFSAKLTHQVLWPLFLDASNNVMYMDPSGNALNYTQVTDAFGHPARFSDMDNKSSFTLLMPQTRNQLIEWPNARKAIVGPLLPVSATYGQGELQLDISCVDGVYGIARRYTNTVLPRVEPLPTVIEPLPTVIEPLPTVIEPLPTVVKPLPANIEVEPLPNEVKRSTATKETSLQKGDKTITITINVA